LDNTIGKRKFTVIKGGNIAKAGDSSRIFVSSYVTDTRLMGVIGLYINWKLKDPEGTSDLHQFFYLDAEEFGFESYRSLTGNNIEEFLYLEQSIIGGLGGQKSELTEDEARFILQEFAEMNSRLSLPWPEEKNEYAFLLQPKVTLTPEQKQVLIRKMCTPLVSEYQMIHYFLMRLFGKDLEGVSYLIDPAVVAVYKTPADAVSRFNFYKSKQPATLCQNVIDRYEDATGVSYLCESLIEMNFNYRVILSEITLAECGKPNEASKPGKKFSYKTCIASAKERSSFKVTSAEAAMMLNRPEFLTVYEIAVDQDAFDRLLLPQMAGCMLTQHDNGRLFLEFNKNNDHVNKKVFRLNEDIHGLYYVSDYGQFIIAAYGLAEIHEIEKKLRKTQLYHNLILAEKYEFKEPVLYEFIQSDYEEFSEFLESLD